MPDVKRTLKIVTEQKIDPAKDSGMEGYPMRNWNIKIMMVNEHTGQLVPATAYDKCNYKLHPSFGKRADQTFKQAPFTISEEGWGEFDMVIGLTPIGSNKIEDRLDHDLNFQKEVYEGTHKVTFKNPKPELLQILAQTGPIPGDSNGAATSKDSMKKRSRKDKNVDMEKLAEGLQGLGEDDLLHIVQMVHDNKTTDTYTKNDVENGEFHVDLYTLPDALVKMLWDYTAARVNMGEM